jgi:hypothetical protein
VLSNNVRRPVVNVKHSSDRLSVTFTEISRAANRNVANVSTNAALIELKLNAVF